MLFEFAMFPKYQQLYILAFDRMLMNRIVKGRKTVWSSANEVFLWWAEDKNLEGQTSMFETEDI